MKELLTNDKSLSKLAKDIKQYSKPLDVFDNDISPRAKMSKEQAARIIQQTWRKKKIKDAMLKSPFYAYRSMIATDDRQLPLSSMMYGHHVAEPLADAREQINNPLISTTEYYHRSTPLNNPILNALFKEFELPDFNKEKYDYLPISLLANNPIEDVLALFEESIPGLQLVKKAPYTVAVLVIPKGNEEPQKKLKDKIRNMGFIASSWEIAENIRRTEFAIPKSDTQIQLDSSLPKTHEELLKSEVVAKLKRVAASEKKYPTALLATCLVKFLKDLPPNLSSGAIQRIATMIDFTNTFYIYHYPRYALCVYSVLHEISLALIENKDPSFLEKEYTRFKEEAAATLASTLRIDTENLSKSTFLATASTSGASACAVAMRIASRMNIPNDEKPKVKIFKPCYYELPNTFNLDSTEDANAADVLMISAGPIVNPEGLTPGIDINLFVKRHIIDAARTKPVTIIVDATTALYKNIELNKEVQQLIATGQLSIIIHESHQKFGLIHTDQAQYGRVFGWCSKEHFSEETLQEVEENSKKDFFEHPDMRIGAFVSTRCEETLEHIKKRHFTNGALLRNTLVSHSLISNHIEVHDDMQLNMDELYFLTDKETSPGSYVSLMEHAAYGAVEYRNSFGHYGLTTADVVGQRRMSPDASDNIDNLVTTCHMRLSRQYGYSTRTMLQQIINNATNKEALDLEEQIVLAGLLHSTTSLCPIVPRYFGEVEFLDRALTADDKKRIIASDKNPKDIVISKSVKDGVATYYMGFYSHGNSFRQAKISDPYILSLISAGTVAQPENHHAVKTYLRTLQDPYFPEKANLPLIFAAVSNAVESCPALKNRPALSDIYNWLSSVEKAIIEEYKPVNKTAFLKALKGLYATKNLSLEQEEDSMKSLLVFLSQVNLFSISPVVLGNKNFIKAIKKVYETNQEILEHLKDAPHKHKAAKEASKVYMQACFKELHSYYSNTKPNEEQRTALLDSLNKAENGYLKVLSVDRSSFSQLARYLLKAVTNFIAGLTLGAAHYFHYKATGTVAFFSGTNSENKLRAFHKELNEDVKLESTTLAAG